MFAQLGEVIMSIENHTCIHLSLVVTPALWRDIVDIAKTSQTTESVVFRKALELMRIANVAKSSGQTIGIINRRSKRLVREIVGV